MRGFGRQCRGQGCLVVPLGRHTDRQLLALGPPIHALGQRAQHLLAQANEVTAAQREGLALPLTAALGAHAHSRKPSGRLTQGQKLRHCKLVKADDLPIAPIMKGKRNCLAQCGRKPGIVSAPATGFICANHGPSGNPSDLSDVLPWLDKGPWAIDRVRSLTPLPVHSVAGDLGVHDTSRRQALPARGLLTIGIPKTVEPLNSQPTAEESLDLLDTAGRRCQRTPDHVPLACTAGYSRPVVESHLASRRSRGAGQLRDQGLQGAVVPQGMTVMAHNGATLVRIRQQHLSKRAQKFRRL